MFYHLCVIFDMTFKYGYYILTFGSSGHYSFLVSKFTPNYFYLPTAFENNMQKFILLHFFTNLCVKIKDRMQPGLVNFKIIQMLFNSADRMK